jgi:hypothetical protein
MASKEPIQNTIAVVEPKSKRKYKTKKEKKKDAAFKKSATIGKVMIKDKLREEKVRSLRELVEKEATMVAPCKTKKKKTKGKDEARPSKSLAQDSTLSLVAKTKGRTKANVGLSAKRTPMVLKKNKRKEKVPEPNEKLVHVDLYSSKESSGDGDSLLVLPLNNKPKKRKGDKHALECPKVDKAHKV